MLDLGKIRDEIDATDDEIVRLFQHRMALTAEVAQYKIETGKAVFDAERERQKLEKLTGEGTNVAQRKMNRPMPTNMLLMPLLRMSVAAASLKKFSGSCCPLARACSARRYLAFRFL